VPSPAEKKVEEQVAVTSATSTEGIKGHGAEGKQTAVDAAEAGPSKVIDMKSMTFEEKKKARMARFGMTEKDKKAARAERFGTAAQADDKKSDRKRGRGESHGKGGIPPEKKNKSDDGEGKPKRKRDPKKPDFESLSKEELETRLKRAEKYGMENENVDAMKAALRKFRFEGK
jgi:hypothetical protein